MEFNDKPAFRIKMQNIARKVDRKLDEEQCDVFFDDLKDYPIRIIEKAMDQALQDRDPDDIFLRRAMITIPEIRQAAEELSKEKRTTSKLGCLRCEPTKGWITETTKDGRFIAHPCDCLAEIVRAHLKRKNRTRADRDLDKFRRETLIAYEVSKSR
ncbi:hypothetical protein ES705_05314 [subsurface metagenome]